MKIIFASIQGVRDGKPLGMVKLVLPILSKFNYKVMYYVSYVDKKTRSAKRINFFHYYLFAVLSILNRIFKKVNIYGNIRFLQEISFDFFLARKLQFPVKLVTTTYSPKSFKKNKKMGGINILIAGNPSEDYICQLYERETSRFSIVIKDAYTNKFRRNLSKKTVGLSDVIVFLSQEVEDSYKKVYGKNIDGILFETSVPVNYIQKPSTFKRKLEGKITFAYIAHSVWLKGLADLIEAWTLVDNKNSELIIGGGLSNDILEFLTKKKYDFSSMNIIFIGSVKSCELQSFYNKADICIVPSLSDNHPTTISESLQALCPVICTEGCGSKNLIQDGINGFIVPISSPLLLSKKIEYFIENPKKKEKFSKNIFNAPVQEINDKNHSIARFIEGFNG